MGKPLLLRKGVGDMYGRRFSYEGVQGGVGGGNFGMFRCLPILWSYQARAAESLSVYDGRATPEKRMTTSASITIV